MTQSPQSPDTKPADEEAKPQTEFTVDEVIDSLTGHDEMSISKQFGLIVGELVSDPSMLRRACIYILKRREGLNEDDARNFTLDLVMKDVMHWFTEENPAAGKGVSEPEQSLEASPSGASEPDAHETNS